MPSTAMAGVEFAGHLGQRPHVVAHARGSFAVRGEDTLHPPVGAQQRAHLFRVHRVPPLHVHRNHLGAVAFGQAQPAVGELAAPHHHHLVAG